MRDGLYAIAGSHGASIVCINLAGASSRLLYPGRPEANSFQSMSTCSCAMSHSGAQSRRGYFLLETTSMACYQGFAHYGLAGKGNRTTARRPILRDLVNGSMMGMQSSSAFPDDLTMMGARPSEDVGTCRPALPLLQPSPSG